jgi:hypothetical protein
MSGWFGVVLDSFNLELLHPFGNDTTMADAFTFDHLLNIQHFESFSASALSFSLSIETEFSMPLQAASRATRQDGVLPYQNHWPGAMLHLCYRQC